MYVNDEFQSMDVYISKDLSLKAKADPETIVLSFGEPDFGPPAYMREKICSEALNYETFIDATSRYESLRGSLSLRQRICEWYLQKYNIHVDPNNEIMITHGGVEAINLAVLCSAGRGDCIMVSQPSYMLYQRTIEIMGRKAVPLERSCSNHQYRDIFENPQLLSASQRNARSLIINSPENPSGYILSAEDWDAVARYALENQLCVIHDEVYDTMEFDRSHSPAWQNFSLRSNSILINSFSKKFGIPGLRIGWMVAARQIIELAAKLHDYMYLGVNIQYEKVAELIVGDAEIGGWIRASSTRICARRDRAITTLTQAKGFRWDRHPLGAMFLFPDVSGVHDRMPEKYKDINLTVGEAVARYFLEEKCVSVVPGYVYGENSKDCVRLVLCVDDAQFLTAVERISEE